MEDSPLDGARLKLFKWPALVIGALALVLTLTLAACSSSDDTTTPTSGSNASTPTPKLSGAINGDGSSTVFPITEAVAEEFGKLHPDVKVTAGISGTGGGFKKFCNGETDFSDASRPISDSEKQACGTKGIVYTEFEIGYDGISVVVNKANTFAQCLTVQQLNAIWKPDSTVTAWNQVDSSFPANQLKGADLYGPGTDSGTFDFFTEQINGKQKSSRSDYNASEDDNVLVQGVAGDDNALGYFGFAYYEENTDKLNVLAVNNGKGCVLPSKTTILDKTYAPLSRPLYIYVRNDVLARPEVHEFVRFYITDGVGLVDQVGYVPAQSNIYEAGLAKLTSGASQASPSSSGAATPTKSPGY